jgi:hypothetical protein
MVENNRGKPKRLDVLIINRDPEAPSLLNPTSGQIFITNQVGSRIMELSDGRLAVPAIVDELTRQFHGVSRETLIRDTEEFLEDSASKGLITWTP